MHFLEFELAASIILHLSECASTTLHVQYPLRESKVTMKEFQRVDLVWNGSSSVTVLFTSPQPNCNSFSIQKLSSHPHMDCDSLGHFIKIRA